MNRVFLITVFITSVLFVHSANSQDFDSYWKQFKSSVKSDDINAVCDLTNFPFAYGWLSSTENLNRGDFMQKSYIPSIETLNLAKINKEVKTKKDMEGFTKTVNLRMDGDDYILSFTEWNEDEGYGGWDDYFFKIINGEYKYYKLVRGD